MQFKTDTKEKFHTIRPEGPVLSATMTEELSAATTRYLQIGADAPAGPPKNVVLNLQDITIVENAAAEKLVNLQQQFYENNASFVICCLDKTIEQFLDQLELLEVMNVTPSESEAWDIVQMEEIERELSDGE